VKLVLAAVGKLRSRELGAAAAEYLKRLRRYTSLEIVEFSEERGEAGGARAKEAERALSFLRREDYLVLCDERGKQLSSREMASFLEERERSGRGRTVFLVGGPFGVDDSLRARADRVLSLSRLTLPHELARLVLTEAVYRAFTITRGESYHHA
jgi:23S rRNA (pseudouridine1915-N3)-methyltransferase